MSTFFFYPEPITSGSYYNPTTGNFDVWAVDEATGRSGLIGKIASFIKGEPADKMLYQIWLNFATEYFNWEQ